MSIKTQFSTRAFGALLAIAAAGSCSCSRSSTSGPEPDPIVGAYQLVSLEEPGPDGTVHRAEATGSLVLTREGRMSVQVMYRDTQTPTGPVQYAQGGYERSADTRLSSQAAASRTTSRARSSGSWSDKTRSDCTS